MRRSFADDICGGSDPVRTLISLRATNWSYALARDVRREAVLAAVVGVVVFAATSLLPNTSLVDQKVNGDIVVYKRYGDFVRSGKVPYRDFFFEYPPGALPVVVGPPLVAKNHYVDASKALQWLLGAAAIVFVAFTLAALGVGRRALFAGTLMVAVIPALLGNLTFTRFDFWPVALMAAALAALVSGRDLLGGAALAVGTAAKIYPVVALPLVLLFVWRRSGRRQAVRVGACFIVVLAAIVLPFAVIAPGGVGDTLHIQTSRPLQIESLGATVLLIAHGLGLYAPWVIDQSGSQNLAGGAARLLAWASFAFGLIALVAIWRAFARSTRTPGQLVAFSAAAVTAYVVFGKVLSPQYLIWLVPLIALIQRTRLAALLLGTLVLTQIYFQHSYHDVVTLGPMIWIVVVRDICLLALFLLLTCDLLSREQQAEPSGPATGRTADREASKAAPAQV
jgi:Glycosyltransferase family 87